MLRSNTWMVCRKFLGMSGSLEERNRSRNRPFLMCLSMQMLYFCWHIKSCMSHVPHPHKQSNHEFFSPSYSLRLSNWSSCWVKIEGVESDSESESLYWGRLLMWHGCDIRPSEKFFDYCGLTNFECHWFIFFLRLLLSIVSHLECRDRWGCANQFWTWLCCSCTKRRRFWYSLLIKSANVDNYTEVKESHCGGGIEKSALATSRIWWNKSWIRKFEVEY